MRYRHHPEAETLRAAAVAIGDRGMGRPIAELLDAIAGDCTLEPCPCDCVDPALRLAQAILAADPGGPVS